MLEELCLENQYFKDQYNNMFFDINNTYFEKEELNKNEHKS